MSDDYTVDKLIDNMLHYQIFDASYDATLLSLAINTQADMLWGGITLNIHDRISAPLFIQTRDFIEEKEDIIQ